LRPYSPGGVLNALAATPNVKRPTSSTHRLRRGLPGYLILFAPHAFAPQRQLRARKPPSPLVFLLISTNFTSTLGIPLSSLVLQSHSIKCSSQVKPGAFTSDLKNRLRALYAQSFRTTLAPSVLPRLLAQSLPVLLLLLPSLSSQVKEFYNPKAFFTHAASLDQGCPHCPIFPTAASRRSLGRVSVPV
jgi:hypothetical protein